MNSGCDSSSFPQGCQRAASVLIFLLWTAVLCAPAARGEEPAEGSAAKARKTLFEKVPRLKDWRFGGSMALSWRNIGPREPGYEVQIQNELYLSEIYFNVGGPVLDGVPFMLEFHMPTGSEGRPELYRFLFRYDRFEDWDLRVGKFLVPFGRYNELYRADMFLTVTRPLLYASPDALDLVVRENSPRPPFSSGYTDIGVRVSYYPPWNPWFLPDEATLFMVNGLSEAGNRLRTFPSPQRLGVPDQPGNGVAVDFGHENNNLADNNNNKTFGGRLVYALGEFDLPWPIPETRQDLNGVSLGLSGMSGQFDLEAKLGYTILGVDLTFEYQGLNVSAEYVYSNTDLKAPIQGTYNNATDPSYRTDYEEIDGFFIQTSFPVLRNPRWGKRVTGVLVFNRIFRRGPTLSLETDENINGTVYDSVLEWASGVPRTDRRITKLTGAFNWHLSDYFLVKAEYSYWVLNRASTELGTRDVYQGVISAVLGF